MSQGAGSLSALECVRQNVCAGICAGRRCLGKRVCAASVRAMAAGAERGMVGKTVEDRLYDEHDGGKG